MPKRPKYPSVKDYVFLVSNIEMSINNSNFQQVSYTHQNELLEIDFPEDVNLDDIVSCNLGFTKGIFDFSDYEGSVKTNPGHLSTFYNSEIDALNFTNQILFFNNFESLQTPKTIWVRIDDQ